MNKDPIADYNSVPLSNKDVWIYGGVSRHTHTLLPFMRAFVRGCYETSASSMAVVFPPTARLVQSGAGVGINSLKRPAIRRKQLQAKSQEVVRC